MHLFLYICASVFLVSLTAIISLLLNALTAHAHHPPHYWPRRPSGLPLVGSLLQLPRSKPWIHYAQWAQRFGDIFHFRVLGREFVVLSSITTALDLFERRSVIYSDRPLFVMCGELVGRDESVLFSPYGDRLREYRRILNSTLGPGVAHRHWEMQQEEVHKFLNGLLESPHQLMPAIRRYAGSVVLRIAYGHVVESDDDKYVLLAEELAHITTAAIQPGKWLVDSFPYLKHVPDWMPGAGFKRWAVKARARSDELIYSPLQEVKKKIEKGTATPSLTADFIENSPENERIIANVASSFYAGELQLFYDTRTDSEMHSPSAGADTSASILATFFLMMTLHPNVQSRASSEIDRVVGTSRLPHITDREKLPFVDAIIKEVYRFHPVAPLIIHSPLKDDIYRDYFIPKGASVIVNIWGILHDEHNFTNPSAFNPDRFMDPPEGTIDPRTIIFGLGRRNCPGKHLGEASVFMAISNALASLRISKALDEAGKVIEPVVDFTSGHTS
ncbi:cytochrome P450 [Mycena alexandri]|uniref:Cytochrome P450 n=1 Tax=Mycena alexandri TaxID=1745969 RepID=A0AAD6TI10_9AGAR|nr:cytochrome P450 [Mycena alexandri]